MSILKKQTASADKFLDKVLLVSAALLVCVVGGSAFLLGEIYHLNPAWLFFAWNSIFLIPIIGGDLRKQFNRPRFVLFFLGWMVVHGAVVVALMRWVSILYWLPIIFIELTAGYAMLYQLFRVEPPEADKAE